MRFFMLMLALGALLFVPIADCSADHSAGNCQYNSYVQQSTAPADVSANLQPLAHYADVSENLHYVNAYGYRQVYGYEYASSYRHPRYSQAHNRTDYANGIDRYSPQFSGYGYTHQNYRFRYSNQTYPRR
jgi:hypothetical protein